MPLTTCASPGSPRLMTSLVSEDTLTPTETCLSGQTRPGRAPAPAQTLYRCFFLSPEMRKVTRGLRDKLSNKVNIDSSSCWKIYFSLDSHIYFICSSNFHRQVRWTFHNASSEVGWKGVLYWNIFQGEENLTFSEFYFLNSTLSSLQANWFKAEQYCRFHNMHLASINSAEEQRELGDHIQSFGEYIKNVRQKYWSPEFMFFDFFNQ